MEGEITDTNYLGNYLNCQVRIGSYVIGVQLDQFERFSPGKRVYLTFAPVVSRKWWKLVLAPLRAG